MNRDRFVRSIDCKSSTAFGKNLKSVIPAIQYQSNKPRRLPNQEIQTDFAGPMNNEKKHEIHLLTCIDKFLKNASAEIFEIANSSIVIKFPDNYLQFHGVLRYFRIDEASFLTGNQEKKHLIDNINSIPASANDHWTIGSVERLISIIKQRLAL